MKLKGVDHLAFVVSDLERSVKFYKEVFDGEVGRSRGFNERDKAAKRSLHTLVKVGNFAFDLFQMAPGDPPKTDTRYLHFAFEVDPGDLDQIQEQLSRMGIPYDGPKAHGGGTGLSIYFNDPDGYQLEATAKFPDRAAYEAEIEKRGAQFGGMGGATNGKEIDPTFSSETTVLLLSLLGDPPSQGRWRSREREAPGKHALYRFIAPTALGRPGPRHVHSRRS